MARNKNSTTNAVITWHNVTTGQTVDAQSAEPQAETRAISVRKVDMAIWLEFRIEAQRRGMSLNTAIAEAVRLWLAATPQEPDPIHAMAQEIINDPSFRDTMRELIHRCVTANPGA